VLKLMYVRYLPYSSNLGVVLCGVILMCTAFAQGMPMAHVQMAYSGYTSTLPSPFTRRLVHITPNAFGA